MLTRRSALSLLSMTAFAPQVALSKTAQILTWDDLIPEGIPYSEIIAEGEVDLINDTWKPVYDENATKLRDDLDGVYVRMPGFITPLDMTADGVTNFLLVPYLGACIHTPPPPANQLILVDNDKPWPTEKVWDAIWVTGTLRISIQDTGLGLSGYQMVADDMMIYEW